MDGIRVGKRVIGAQSPVTVGWENIPRVEGGPVKQFVFTWFQPTMLFALIAFWYYAPNSIATASTGIAIGIGFKALLLSLEWVNPRYDSWRLTWKELCTDLFYVGLGYTLLKLVDVYIGDEVVIEAVRGAFDWEKFAWFTGLPLLLQAFLISFIVEFGQYWMHRLMHNWTPFWLTHAPHHHLTQLNAAKGAVGNPIELFLISLSVVALFDLQKTAVFAAYGTMTVISVFAHANVRADPPRWYAFFFTTIRHHSLHHSTDYDATRSNYGNSLILLDRIFGTYRDGEGVIVGQDERRRLSIWEQTVFPFRPAFDRYRARREKVASRTADTAPAA